MPLDWAALSPLMLPHLVAKVLVVVGQPGQLSAEGCGIGGG
jgi:hypothetical protein